MTGAMVSKGSLFLTCPPRAGEMNEVLVGKCSTVFGSHNGESVYEVIREDAVVCG